MKVYINIDNLSVVKIEREKPFYQGSNFIDRIRVLFDKTDVACSPTIMFKLPTARRIGPVQPIGLDEGETRLINEDGQVWYYYDFIVSGDIGLLAYPGQLEASIVLNYYNTNGTIIKQAVVGTVVNEVVKTTVFGEGNIIVVGEDPEIILNNLNLTIANLANRQSSIEAVWTNQISKLIPVIKNYLNDSKDTRIEFYDDLIKIVHAGDVVATFDREDGLVVDGDIEGKDMTLSGDISANSPNTQATFNEVVAKDAFIEHFASDDISTGDVYASDDVHIGEESVKGNISLLKQLSRLIIDSLDEETASIYFTDNSITITHKGDEMVRFSAEDGTHFYSNVEIDKEVNIKGDIIAAEKGTHAEFMNIYAYGNMDVSGETTCFGGLTVWENLTINGQDVVEMLNDRYTKEETNNLLNRIPRLTLKKVSSLPKTNIDPYTVYLVLSSIQETGNIYTEYLYIDSKWEKMGTMNINLSNYPTREELQKIAADFDTRIKRLDKKVAYLEYALSVERERATIAEKNIEEIVVKLHEQKTIRVTDDGVLRIGRRSKNIYVEDGVVHFLNNSAYVTSDGTLRITAPHAIVGGRLIMI